MYSENRNFTSKSKVRSMLKLACKDATVIESSVAVWCPKKVCLACACNTHFHMSLSGSYSCPLPPSTHTRLTYETACWHPGVNVKHGEEKKICPNLFFLRMYFCLACKKTHLPEILSQPNAGIFMLHNLFFFHVLLSPFLSPQKCPFFFFIVSAPGGNKNAISLLHSRVK